MVTIMRKLTFVVACVLLSSGIARAQELQVNGSLGLTRRSSYAGPAWGEAERLELAVIVAAHHAITLDVSRAAYSDGQVVNVTTADRLPRSGDAWQSPAWLSTQGRVTAAMLDATYRWYPLGARLGPYVGGGGVIDWYRSDIHTHWIPDVGSVIDAGAVASFQRLHAFVDVRYQDSAGINGASMWQEPITFGLGWSTGR